MTASATRTGLEYRCQVTTFSNFPAIEWVAHFHNKGVNDTPVISDIQPLDAIFAAKPSHQCWIHHSKGSLAQQDDFEPLQTPLRLRANLRLAPVSGRSSNGTLPFFNLELGTEGVIGAIGWTGGWAAQFLPLALVQPRRRRVGGLAV